MKFSDLNLSPGAVSAFSYVLSNNPSTKADICSHMGIGVSTGGKYVVELCEKGLLRERGVADSSGGRKPMLYEINCGSYFVFAVNISVIYCEVAVLDFCFNVSYMESFRIGGDDGPEEVLPHIALLFADAKERLGLSDDDFVAMGVSVFGKIKNEHGVLYRPILQYMNKKWIDYPILDKLRELMPLKIFSEKGINASAMLECHYGKGRDSHNMIYVLCAMNIRSAIIQNGAVVGSSPFFEDAFGHMVINYDGPYCQCGQYGCLNCYASIPAIVEAFRKNVKRGEPTTIPCPIDEISINQILQYAEKGDVPAKSAIIDRARMLGIALGNYVNIVSPDKVVLAGILVEQSQLYYDTAVDTARKRLGLTGGENVEFQRLGSFSHPLTLGAGATVLKNINECI